MAAGEIAAAEALSAVPGDQAAAELRVHLQLEELALAGGRGPAVATGVAGAATTKAAAAGNSSGKAGMPRIDWGAIEKRSAALSVEADRALRAAAEASAQALRRAPTAQEKEFSAAQRRRMARPRWAIFAAVAAVLVAGVSIYRVWIVPPQPSLQYGQTAELPVRATARAYSLPGGTVAVLQGGAELRLTRNATGQDTVRQDRGSVTYRLGPTPANVEGVFGVLAGSDDEFAVRLPDAAPARTQIDVTKGRVVLVAIGDHGYTLEAGQSAYIESNGTVQVVSTGQPAPVAPPQNIPLPLPPPPPVSAPFPTPGGLG
ncbi:MAG: hypothetical protein ACREJ2_14215, partial [Planctomycetota bacterium]